MSGAATSIPALIGVIHLPALPASPLYRGAMASIVDRVVAETALLADAGFTGVIIENFGDMPFVPGRVDAVTVAAMTSCALAARQTAPTLALGINVLRNDASSALAIAAVADAAFIRVNVHTSARLTDQGLIQGRAHETLRLRRQLGIEHVRLLCDLAVKHSAPLAAQPLADHAAELAQRGLADALLLTGHATGAPVDRVELETVRAVATVPLLVASGARIDNVHQFTAADGIIVGSSLRRSGRAGDPLDAQLCRSFAEAFWQYRAS